MRSTFKPWLFVITGIIFNVMAAILSHYVIGINNLDISKLESRINQHDIYIEGQWRAKTALDQSEGFLIGLLATSLDSSLNIRAELSSMIQAELEILAKNHQFDPEQLPLSIDYDTIKQTINQLRQGLINSINDSYLERQDIEQQLSPLMQKNSNIMSLSIFLQMTGLILVLSRDLFER